MHGALACLPGLNCSGSKTSRYVTIYIYGFRCTSVMEYARDSAIQQLLVEEYLVLFHLDWEHGGAEV